MFYFPFQLFFLNVKGLHVLTEFHKKPLQILTTVKECLTVLTGMPERLQSYKQADIQSTEHLNIQINFLIALSRLSSSSRQLSETLYTDHRNESYPGALLYSLAPEGTTSQHT